MGIVATDRACAANVPNTLARIGMWDADHAGPGGVRVDELGHANPSGWVVGTSVNFSRSVPETEAWARTAWSYAPNGAMAVRGYFDPLHTRADGFRVNEPIRVNNQGVVLGSSQRFTGMADSGNSAWLQDRWGNIVKIGFYDAAHTAIGADGPYKFSEGIDLNNRNQAVGFSIQANGATYTAWLANSVGQIQRIGLFDPSHVSANGAHHALPVAINDAGYVIGVSRRYPPGYTESRGLSAWARMPWATTRIIGFQDGVHRNAYGVSENHVERLTESGYMSGWARRYRPSNNESAGQTAWLTHVHGPNRPVGFYTGAHESTDRIAVSQILALNERGIAAGLSRQYWDVAYDPQGWVGATAWLALPDGTTLRVGFYDAEHTHNGVQENHVWDLNGVDSAVGTALRYTSTGTYLGTDAWVANTRGQITRIGLEDARHTRANGYREQRPEHINDTGWIAGSTARFNGAARVGKTAWLYHRATRTYRTFELSVRPSDGYANSWITHLYEDGSVLGGFTRIAQNGTELPPEMFLYTEEQGVVVMTDRFEFGMIGFGWEWLEPARWYNWSADVLLGAAFGPDPAPGAQQTKGVFRFFTP